MSSVVSSERALIFFFYMAASAQTNTPRQTGMALLQPHDWFGAVQISLSLAIRIVCQKMDECNLSKSISTMFHIYIEEKLLFDSCRYHFIAQPYNGCIVGEEERRTSGGRAVESASKVYLENCTANKLATMSSSLLL